MNKGWIPTALCRFSYESNVDFGLYLIDDGTSMEEQQWVSSALSRGQTYISNADDSPVLIFGKFGQLLLLALSAPVGRLFGEDCPFARVGSTHHFASFGWTCRNCDPGAPHWRDLERLVQPQFQSFLERRWNDKGNREAEMLACLPEVGASVDNLSTEPDPELFFSDPASVHVLQDDERMRDRLWATAARHATGNRDFGILLGVRTEAKAIRPSFSGPKIFDTLTILSLPSPSPRTLSLNISPDPAEVHGAGANSTFKTAASISAAKENLKHEKTVRAGRPVDATGLADEPIVVKPDGVLAQPVLNLVNDILDTAVTHAKAAVVGIKTGIKTYLAAPGLAAPRETSMCVADQPQASSHRLEDASSHPEGETQAVTLPAKGRLVKKEDPSEEWK